MFAPGWLQKNGEISGRTDYARFFDKTNGEGRVRAGNRYGRRRGRVWESGNGKSSYSLVAFLFR